MSAESKAINRFITKVQSCLVCYPSTKRHLVHGFKHEIHDFAREGKTVTMNSLVENFGTPHDVAAQLQEGVREEEYLSVKRGKRIIKWVCIVVGFLVFAGLIALLLSLILHTEVRVTESIVDITRW